MSLQPSLSLLTVAQLARLTPMHKASAFLRLVPRTARLGLKCFLCRGQLCLRDLHLTHPPHLPLLNHPQTQPVLKTPTQLHIFQISRKRGLGGTQTFLCQTAPLRHQTSINEGEKVTLRKKEERSDGPHSMSWVSASQGLTELASVVCLVAKWILTRSNAA